MSNLFYILVGGAVAYLLSSKQTQKIEQQFQSRINELSDDVSDLSIKQEEAQIRSDVFSQVEIKQFVGIVGDWKPYDTYISARWLIHVVNKSSVAIRLNLSNVNVTIGGQSQLKYASMSKGCALSEAGREGSDVWIITSYFSSVKLYPKGTIKNAVSELKETLSDNVSCTIKYSLSSPAINAGVPSDSKIITLSGSKSKCYFCQAIGAGYAGTSILKSAGLIPNDANIIDLTGENLVVK